MTAAFARVRAELGPVQILVTSAGIEAFDPLLEITPEQWDRIIAINLTGTFSCVQAAVADMLAGGWGRIVTISSSSAQSGAPNMAHYAASKGGVISLTKALARGSGRAMGSPSTPSRRASSTPPWPARPRRPASSRESTSSRPWCRSAAPALRPTSPPPARFCAPTAADYITGQIIGVNGGMYI